MATATQSLPLPAGSRPARWSLLDYKLGIMFLRGLFKTGLAPEAAFGELARLQPKHAPFWLGAARNAKEGRPFHQYLDGRWPTSLTTPIQVAETSGRLDDVFRGMERTLQQQIESGKLLRKMYYPIGIAIGGIAATIFMLTTVIPSMIGKMRFDREPAIVTFTKTAQTLVTDYGAMALLSLVGLVAFGIWKWYADDKFKETVLAIVNEIPLLGWSTRWIWFSVWAQYVSIMIKADILPTEAFRVTLNTLPQHLRGAINRINVQLAHGKSLTDAATPGKDPEDPRHLLPIHIVNAFRMTDQTGHGDSQFAIASETLFEPGKEMLDIGITIIKYILMTISAAGVTIPFIFYLQAIGTLVKSASH